MAPIVESIEIARRPEDVFAYVTDPDHLAEWQESVVSVRREGDRPASVGSRVVITRHVGSRDMTMTAEISELHSPTTWGVRGIDGPVRGTVKGKIEPLDSGERSRVTIELDFEAHGLSGAARAARRSPAGWGRDAEEHAELEAAPRGQRIVGGRLPGVALPASRVVEEGWIWVVAPV